MSELVKKGPCPECPSSDACASYDDGTSFCFSCDTFFPSSDGGKTTSRKKKSGLIRSTPRELQKRRIQERTAKKWGYGVGQYHGANVQVANYKDDSGQVVAQKIRTASKEFTILGDAKKMGLYGKWLWRSGRGKLAVVEGELDALALSQIQDLKWPVVSVPNGAAHAHKAIVKDLAWVEGFDEVVFMLDNDDKGKAAAKKCAAQLSPGKAKIAVLPDGIKDACDGLIQGRSREVMDAFFNATTFRPDGIVDAVGALAMTEQQGAMMPVGTFPYPEMQRMSRGYFASQIITICSGSGMGKSEFVRELAVHHIKQTGGKVGYVALEEGTPRSLVGIAGILMDKRIDLEPEPLKVDGFMEVFNRWIRDKVFFYDHFGSTDGDNLLGKLKYLRVACECDVIVLDHISIVVSDMEEADERKTIDRLMTRLRSFTEATGAVVFLVSHLKRPQGTPHEEGGKTSLSHLRGSAAIGQLSDLTIGLERNQQATGNDRHVSQLRFLKNRKTGMTGVADRILYDCDTGRMSPYEEFEFDELTDNTTNEEEDF